MSISLSTQFDGLEDHELEMAINQFLADLSINLVSTDSPVAVTETINDFLNSLYLNGMTQANILGKKYCHYLGLYNADTYLDVKEIIYLEQENFLIIIDSRKMSLSEKQTLEKSLNYLSLLIQAWIENYVSKAENFQKFNQEKIMLIQQLTDALDALDRSHIELKNCYENQAERIELELPETLDHMDIDADDQRIIKAVLQEALNSQNQALSEQKLTHTALNRLLQETLSKVMGHDDSIRNLLSLS